MVLIFTVSESGAQFRQIEDSDEMSQNSDSDNELENEDNVNAVRASFTWTVKNFSQVYRESEHGEVIKSPTFEVKESTRLSKWEIHLFPKGSKESYKKSISLYAKCLSKGGSYVKISMAIMNNNNRLSDDHPLQYILFEYKDIYGFSDFKDQKALFDAKSTLLREDNLTILWDILLDRITEYNQKMKIGKIESFEDYGMLYDNQKLSDFQFLVEENDGTYKFYAHKYILTKRSSIFAALFKYEKSISNIHVTDVSLMGMDGILRSIYQDERQIDFNFVDSNQFCYLTESDKNASNNLKNLCDERICTILTLDNAIELLLLAEKCNLEKLKAKAIELIALDSDNIIENPEFESLKNSNPEIASTIMQEVEQKIKKLEHFCLNLKPSKENNTSITRSKKVEIKTIISNRNTPKNVTTQVETAGSANQSSDEDEPLVEPVSPVRKRSRKNED